MKPERLGDFLAWQPTPSVALIGGGLLYEQTRAVIYGRYKSYKSLVVARLALCLADGQPWLGFPVQEQGVTALYLQIELSHKMLQVRVKKMWPEGTPKVEPYIWTEHFLKLDTDRGMLELDTVLEQTKPQVLIIDPVYKILSGNILEAVSVQRLLDNLDIMIAKHGCSVVLVSHTRKGSYEEWGSDDLLGSVFFSAWADTLIRLERSTTGLTAKFEVVRHAETELPARNYLFNRETLDFELDSGNLLDALDGGGKPKI